MEKKDISILGSTGSIGTQTLSIVDKYNDDFNVVAMCAGKNYDLFESQIEKYSPRYVCMADDDCNKRLMEKYKYTDSVMVIGGQDRTAVLGGIEGMDVVVSAIVGIDGLKPTYEAIKTGTLIALANKEVLVAGGSVIKKAVEKYSSVIVPVDSEHSAIWQCMSSGNKCDVDKIILTASGGAFRGYTKEMLEKVTVENALKHPNWNMGKKVTVDSATLMNKGLEVIEAVRLFNVDLNDIEVIVQPESIIHSMVKYKDNSIIAQMSNPSMLIPIQLALTYPERKPTETVALDFEKLSAIHFEKPNLELFPCLRLGYTACGMGDYATVLLNSADEIAVQSFLSNKIKFTDIPYYIEKTISEIGQVELNDIEEIFELDKKAREFTLNCINKGK